MQPIIKPKRVAVQAWLDPDVRTKVKVLALNLGVPLADIWNDIVIAGLKTVNGQKARLKHDS